MLLICLVFFLTHCEHILAGAPISESQYMNNWPSDPIVSSRILGLDLIPRIGTTQKRAVDSITFYLYTCIYEFQVELPSTAYSSGITYKIYRMIENNIMKNPVAGYILQIGNISNLLLSPFNVRKRITMVTHGWTQDYTEETCQGIKDALLRVGDFNVILVDWKELAGDPQYPKSADNVKPVGEVFSEMINFLINQGATPSQFHLIGHSLGAHVVGIAGQSVAAGKVARISGLDPARPKFECDCDNLDDRLDPSDANFVDIVHTCSGVLGFKNPLGHVDVYPNGGFLPQPGCCCLEAVYTFCSHGRSWMYFMESIDSAVPFLAVQCASWRDFKKGNCFGSPVPVFNPVSSALRGNFFLTTNGEFPFVKNGSDSYNWDSSNDRSIIRKFL